MRTLRIAVATALGRKVGGTEHYLDAIIRDLARDHEIALWCDMEGPLDRDPIAATPGITRWTVTDTGLDRALAALAAWKPDLLYVHDPSSPAVEKRLLTVAPAVLFRHNYNGTCISGHKTWKTPRPTPCSRPLGGGCLLHFYPHRCGGLNPVTMATDFRRARSRARLLPRYRAVLTTSGHMRDEMIRNGAAPERTFTPPFVALGPDEMLTGERKGPDGDHVADNARAGRALDRLLFIGRMDVLKGGEYLLQAVAEAARQLGRPLRLTLAGDGEDRLKWERLSATLRAQDPPCQVEFVGWVGSSALRALCLEADLLVVPSIWPEPFGIVGPQAGSTGLPAAAFDVGGISEWLTDGVNGHLAPGRRPRAEELAGAIVRCLEDRDHYRNLRTGAVALSHRFAFARHATALREIFRSITEAER